MDLPPKRYYGSAFDEAARLSYAADGVLELVRTQELLRRWLPSAPARVLDVGGGPGAHARWLRADGYEVHLVDPVPRHVEQAARIEGLTAEEGDARALTAADASYDVVLLLGPLYHLLGTSDRRRALDEAYRVLRPGGLLAAAGINRYASLFEHTALAQPHREDVRRSIGGILESRMFDGRQAFTAVYFHTGAELNDEVSAAGFGGAEVFGVEGPAWSLIKATEQHTGESLVGTPLFDSVLTAARLAEPYPELLASSSHLLSLARRGPPDQGRERLRQDGAVTNAEDMRPIPAGEIVLRDEGTRTDWRVEVADFLLAPVPVTRERYAAVAGGAPAGTASTAGAAGAPGPPGPRTPVTEVSWLDAVRFCNLLSRADGLDPCYAVGEDPDAQDVTCDWRADGYRLPTEAEWEYACRAGTSGVRYGELDDIAWYRANSGGAVHDVATREPNAWGLHDMIGNVWEWCWDVYDPRVYGPYRVFRGGGWCDQPRGCRASCRRKSHPTLRVDDLGFRLARTPPGSR